MTRILAGLLLVAADLTVLFYFVVITIGWPFASLMAMGVAGLLLVVAGTGVVTNWQ